MDGSHVNSHLSHAKPRVIERAGGRDARVGVEAQHAPQQIDEEWVVRVAQRLLERYAPAHEIATLLRIGAMQEVAFGCGRAQSRENSQTIDQW